MKTIAFANRVEDETTIATGERLEALVVRAAPDGTGVHELLSAIDSHRAYWQRPDAD